MSTDRHTMLTSAGWRFDAEHDRYAAPGEPTPGERWYNQAAAWLVYQQQQAAAQQPKSADPRVSHSPAAGRRRRQKPE